MRELARALHTMKIPIGEFRALESVESTQSAAREAMANGEDVAVLFAHHQTGGRGRFDRSWHSERGSSLTMSIILSNYANHPKPYLLGMAVACAAAGVLHCRLQWPNDLVSHGRKLGGVLTEIVRGVPIIGVGVNLNQSSFPPELEDRAISLAQAHGGVYDAQTVGAKILKRLESEPEPNSWEDLAPVWMLFDETPGKEYQLQSGETAIALGIGSEGQLLCSVEGESRSVLAADAIFG